MAVHFSGQFQINVKMQTQGNKTPKTNWSTKQLMENPAVNFAQQAASESQVCTSNKTWPPPLSVCVKHGRAASDTVGEYDHQKMKIERLPPKSSLVHEWVFKFSSVSIMRYSCKNILIKSNATLKKPDSEDCTLL